MDVKVTVVYTLNYTKMMDNKPQMLTFSIHTITTETGAPENIQFHRVPYLGEMLSPYTTNCQFIVDTDLLILYVTEYLVSQQKQQLPGLQ